MQRLLLAVSTFWNMDYLGRIFEDWKLYFQMVIFWIWRLKSKKIIPDMTSNIFSSDLKEPLVSSPNWTSTVLSSIMRRRLSFLRLTVFQKLLKVYQFSEINWENHFLLWNTLIVLRTRMSRRTWGLISCRLKMESTCYLLKQLLMTFKIYLRSYLNSLTPSCPTMIRSTTRSGGWERT